MYGEDSNGRRVSLLNDNSTTIDSSTTTIFTRPSIPDRTRLKSCSSGSSIASREGRSTSSRSSFSGSPRHSHSPPTPPFSRLNSQSSLLHSTPSPMTPQFGFEMDPHAKRNSMHDGNPPAYYQQQQLRGANNSYPSMQDSTSQPYFNMSSQQPLSRMPEYDFDPYHHHHDQRILQPLQTQLSDHYSQATVSHLNSEHYGQHHQSNHQHPTPTSATTDNSLPSITQAPPSVPIKADPSTANTASSNSAATKNAPAKKKYPCPHAKTYSCTDTFTTSGHAARHGKKHTGEKNIHCPTCDKAFTRKDNMKQHERTHKGGSRSGSAAASPVIGSKSVVGGSRKDSVTSSVNGDAMDVDSEDGFASSGSGRQVSVMGGRGGRPKMKSELSEIMEGLDRDHGLIIGEGNEEDGEGESPGLDALATAASEMS